MIQMVSESVAGMPALQVPALRETFRWHFLVFFAGSPTNTLDGGVSVRHGENELRTPWG